MKSHPHSRMLEEVLRNGYNFGTDKINVFVLDVVGSKTSYQVYNEKTSDSALFFQPKEAVDFFLSITKNERK